MSYIKETFLPQIIVDEANQCARCDQIPLASTLAGPALHIMEKSHEPPQQ